MVCCVQAYHFGPVYAGVTVGTLVAYTTFTVGITQWRTKFRKEMNALENQASNQALESLINYETVKVRAVGVLFILHSFRMQSVCMRKKDWRCCARVALASSRCLHSTLSAAPVRFAHAVVSVSQNKKDPLGRTVILRHLQGSGRAYPAPYQCACS